MTVFAPEALIVQDDSEYKRNTIWRQYILSPCGKYCYLVLLKNASNTFIKELLGLNWKIERRDPKAEFYLAHLQDPVERWIKGFAQFCIQTDLNLEEVLNDPLFPIPGIYDNHTMPASHTWHDLFHKIHFFKLGTTGLEDFIKPDYDLTVTLRLHAANPDKLAGYELIKQRIEPKLNFLASFLYHDMIKYDELLSHCKDASGSPLKS